MLRKKTMFQSKTVNNEESFIKQLNESMEALSLTAGVQGRHTLKINLQSYLMCMFAITAGISTIVLMLRQLVIPSQINNAQNRWNNEIIDEEKNQTCQGIVSLNYPHFKHKNYKRYLQSCNDILSGDKVAEDRYKYTSGIYQILPTICFEILKELCGAHSNKHNALALEELPEKALAISLGCLLGMAAMYSKNALATKNDLTKRELESLQSLMQTSRFKNSLALDGESISSTLDRLNDVSNLTPSARLVLYKQCFELIRRVSDYEHSICGDYRNDVEGQRFDM